MPRVPPISFTPVRADTRLMDLQSAGPSPEAAALPGRQLQQFGEGLVNLGAAGARIAADFQQEANRVQVIAAQNKAMGLRNELSYGGQNDPGFYALKGEAAIAPRNGASLAEDYQGRLRAQLTEIEGTLGNDAQKAAFAVWRGGFEEEFTGQVRRHQLQEFKAHQVSTYTGAVELSVNEAMANWGDPEKVRQSIDGVPVPGSENERYGGVRQAAYLLAKAQGKSEMEATYDSKKAASAAHLGVITQALGSRNASYASKYLDEYRKDMLEADVLKVQGQMMQHLDIQAAQAAVGASVREFANRFQPTDMDRLQNIVRGLESNGADMNPDGTPLTSPKGAKYAMQVMPDTAKAPGFGIRPAADDSPAEYNRVGREYLGALVKKYGNLGQAMAAYNAGPGAVDTAIAQAKKDGKPTEWITHLPQETVAYVRKGVERFGAGQGGTAMPTEQEFIADAVARLGASASPEAIKTTQAAAEHQYGIISKSLKARDDFSIAEGMRWLETNGGAFSAMPAQLKAAIPPKEWDNLRSFGQKVAKGDDITNMAVYQQLAANPARLKSLSDDAFYRLRGELSEGDFKHFANERANLISGKGGNTPEDLNTEAINATLNDRLRSLGRDPTPKDGSKDAAVVGELRRHIRQSILNAQSVTGKKMTDAEVEKHVDGLFAKSVSFRNTFLGVETGGRTSRQLLAMAPGDIPGDIRDRLKADFRRQGISDPTDAQLLGAYWSIKGAKR